MFLNNYRRKFPLVNSSVIKKIYRRVCSASKSVGNIITIGKYYRRIYQRKNNYRQKIHWRKFSVGELITDGICVLRRWKNFIGKIVKSCSVWG